MSIVTEFSRVYATDRLPVGGLSFALRAGEAECRALARRFDLPAIGRLEATGTVARRTPGGLVTVTGTLTAEVTQRCVVSLEPMPATVAADFQRFFAPSLETAAEIEIDPEEDLLEPLDGEMIDVGEIVAEELSLALDPYPRLDPAPASCGDDEATLGAFSALAALRRH